MYSKYQTKHAKKESEQMEVYIIEAYYYNGESEVKGVFSTFEKAKAYYDKHLKMNKNYSYTINKWTIDTSESSGKWWGDEMLSQGAEGE